MALKLLTADYLSLEGGPGGGPSVSIQVRRRGQAGSESDLAPKKYRTASLNVRRADAALSLVIAGAMSLPCRSPA